MLIVIISLLHILIIIRTTFDIDETDVLYEFHTIACDERDSEQSYQGHIEKSA